MIFNTYSSLYRWDFARTIQGEITNEITCHWWHVYVKTIIFLVANDVAKRNQVQSIVSIEMGINDLVNIYIYIMKEVIMIDDSITKNGIKEQSNISIRRRWLRR